MIILIIVLFLYNILLTYYIYKLRRQLQIFTDIVVPIYKWLEGSASATKELRREAKRTTDFISDKK